MRKVFIPNLNRKQIIIQNEEYNHLVKVLRLKKTDKIIGFDGKGNVAELEIKQINKNFVECEVKKYYKIFKNYTVSLGIPIIKHKNFNTILKNVQQLGVKKIFPFVSEHSVVKKIDNEKIDKWNKVLIESSKQSGNFYIPFIERIFDINDFIKMKELQLKIVFYEKSENFLKNFEDKIKKMDNLLILLGPEGGFSSEEITFLKDNGFLDLKLNTNILRSENAVVVILSIIKYLKGEL